MLHKLIDLMDFKRMFSKILIANRGEIACRVMRTAYEMGLSTVAVYSEADIYANHTFMADESICIGSAPARDSYLSVDKIIAACKQTGAEAVHPGYGFLSERAEFVRKLEAEGLVFIGPSAKAVDAMGDKITSREIAEKAGVPVVPGHTADRMKGVASLEDAHRIAAQIGYPIMIKASAGGGGKGMRVAHSSEELEEALTRAKSEAASSFGDDRVFIEKFIVSPRHIEIQILADAYGTTLWLGERECSIQRRNQKVIEETPSPILNEATRRKMGECAVSLAKAVGYTSAGTVEFIVDAQNNFYFLEMNTRLQVEHPITELTTGIDLVEYMIRIAAGEALDITQETIKRCGHAIEARICAEDPERNFMPATGRLTRYETPSQKHSLNLDQTVTIRNDSGVCEGSEISMFYDPMIAKLCVHAPDRSQAISGLQSALDSFVIRGPSHNISFLSAILAEKRFQAGDTTTGFISDVWPEGFTHLPPHSHDMNHCLIAVAAIQHAIDTRPRNASKGAKSSHESRANYVIAMRGSEEMTWHIELIPQKNQPKKNQPEKNQPEKNQPETAQLSGKAKLGKQCFSYSGDWCPGSILTTFWFGDSPPLHLQVDTTRLGMTVQTKGRRACFYVLNPTRAALLALLPDPEASDESRTLLCPMPGLVIALNVAQGDNVEAGDVIAIVEAMKMENSLRAPCSGRVAHIPVQVGDSLNVGAVIMEFSDQ